MSDFVAYQRTVELEQELRRVNERLHAHHNGMIDIVIMLDEDDIDAAKAKAESFLMACDMMEKR